MQVTFLGTGAAPSMPIPFCTCRVCMNARRVGGKNLRRRSSIIINADLLVDIGPDLATASYEHNLFLANISVCLQTHAHEDHLDVEFIISRHTEYGTEVANGLLFVGSGETLRVVDEIVRRRCEYGSIFDPNTQAALKMNVLTVAPYETCTVGNYRATGYPANHATDQASLLYSIEQGDRAVFYGTDTSVLSEEVWEHLLSYRTRYDLIILDHTYGIGLESRPEDHLGSRDVIAHADRFRESGLLKDTGIVYATHISHEGNAEHDELDKNAGKYGYRVAFDGLRLVLDG
ncbi:MAG: MBL fold metallo-hydrolase [Candidatus Poribacteria bacterium]|nr:MBL fold metallo-hydrolase [Candidatus Poribacteria bacterium]